MDHTNSDRSDGRLDVEEAHGFAPHRLELLKLPIPSPQFYWSVRSTSQTAFNLGSCHVHRSPSGTIGDGADGGEASLPPSDGGLAAAGMAQAWTWSTTASAQHVGGDIIRAGRFIVEDETGKPRP